MSASDKGPINKNTIHFLVQMQSARYKETYTIKIIMDSNKLKQILKSVQPGKTDIKKALDELKHLPYEDIGCAKVDHHRELRHGIPEVVFAEGKETKDIKDIADAMLRKSGKLLITKASKEVYKSIGPLGKKHGKKIKFFEKSGVIMAGSLSGRRV